MMNNRFRNIGFWVGLIGIVLTAAGIDPATLTSWDVLANNLLEIIRNPYMIVSVVMAVVGVFTDPTTPGIKDHE